MFFSLISVYLGMSDKEIGENDGNLKLRNKKVVVRAFQNKNTRLDAEVIDKLLPKPNNSSEDPVVSIVNIRKQVVDTGYVLKSLSNLLCSKQNTQSNNNSNNNLVNFKNNLVLKMSLSISQFLKIVPEFDGTSSKLHKFLKCCDLNFIPLVKDADKQMFLELVGSKLCGRAYDVVKYNQFQSWEELKNELCKQFEERKSVEHLQIELVQARQNSNESVLEFGNRIEQLLSSLNDACIAREGVESVKCINNLNSGTALRAFVDGLRIEKIQTVINSCRFKALKEAIDKAIEEEVTLNKKSFLDLNNSPKCQLCNKRGHIATKCFSLKSRGESSNSKNNSSSSIESNSNNNSKSTRLFCNYCKRKGHLIENCFKKNNQNKSGAQNSENSKPLGQDNTTARVGDL